MIQSQLVVIAAGVLTGGMNAHCINQDGTKCPALPLDSKRSWIAVEFTKDPILF